MTSEDTAATRSADPSWALMRSSAVVQPAISVVMPVYNREGTVRAAVDSVLSLSDEASFEFIIVDDGSTDRTRDILGALDAPAVTVALLHANAGANMARNIGASLARAPVLAFLDSDDIYLPGRLARPLGVLAEAPDVGIVLSAFTTAKREKSTIVRLPDRTYGNGELVRFLARHVLPPSTTGVTIRREVFLKAGGFDPTVKRIQDLDMLLRAAQHTKGASISQTLWHKNWQVDGISSNPATYFAALLALIDRHPLYHDAERDTRDYLIARHIISLALSRNFVRAWQDYRQVRDRFTALPATLPKLIRSYFATRHARHRSKLELFDKAY